MDLIVRLAAYGPLAPGQPNHHLAGLTGLWSKGFVRGKLTDTGWGAALGFPALVPNVSGDPIEVHVFESTELVQELARLDAFEGAEYARIVIDVETDAGTVPAWIYVSAAKATDCAG